MPHGRRVTLLTTGPAMDECEQAYPLRGDVRCCHLPYNHDDDCATANRAAATPTEEDRHG